MAKIYIVNEKDEIIGEKEREDVELADIYRVAGIWITNSEGDILLAQRSFNKSHDPGKWGPAVAGTVEVGETYKQNVLKEALEELGLKDISLIEGPKTRSLSKHNYFCQWYFYQTDRSAKDFSFQKEEIEQIQWFPKKQLLTDLEKSPNKYLKGIPRILNLFEKNVAQRNT